jgi:hypothetical protein
MPTGTMRTGTGLRSTSITEQRAMSTAPLTSRSIRRAGTSGTNVHPAKPLSPSMSGNVLM